MNVTTAKARVATCWLDGCSGCHMSLLDIDEAIVEVGQKADLVYGPLVDAQEFPEAVDVAFVEGAVSSTEDQKLLQTIRKRSRILVSLGDCAVTSNVPSMRNGIPTKRLLMDVYGSLVPNDGVPSLLKHAVPLHQVVKVDLHVPGCPPRPEAIAYVIRELLDGRKPDVAAHVKFG